MKKINLSIFILILVILTEAILISGCSGFTPNTPNNNTSEEYDEVNTELSYIKISPSHTIMSVNQSKVFEVKAYNSEGRLVAMDVSKIRWSARYTSCYFCIEWKLSPAQGSAKTTFTPTNPNKAGKYKIFANYGGSEGKWAEVLVEVN